MAKLISFVYFFQQTLHLDPADRFTIEECLDHVAFQTERLISRPHVPVKHIDSHTTTKKRKNDFSDVNRCVLTVL